MFKKGLIIFLALFFVFFAFVVKAQVQNGDVVLEISPKYPKAGEEVWATLSTYSTDLNNARISWIVDGETRLEGMGKKTKAVVEQLIRPTGLIDPEIEVRPTTGQVKDLLKEISLRIAKGERVLVTTMTKRMAEDLAEYLKSKAQNGVADLKVHYLHSDVDTLDRSDVLDDLRLGNVDVVVGINLLREGLDLPEVSLVAILDADKEGFLRSHTSLIQTMGRAARHLNGRVILYADRITRSMKLAMDEVERRRKYQIEYNQRHDITPVSIAKPVRGKLLIRATLPDSTPQIEKLKDINPEALTPKDKKDLIKSLKSQMNQAAKDWDFELAAAFRDSLQKLTN